MIAIKFFLVTGFVGMDQQKVEFFETMPSREELDDMAWDYALDNAGAYGVEPYPEEELDEGEVGLYSDNIEGWWVLLEEDDNVCWFSCSTL